MSSETRDYKKDHNKIIKNRTITPSKLSQGLKSTAYSNNGEKNDEPRLY